MSVAQIALSIIILILLALLFIKSIKIEIIDKE